MRLSGLCLTLTLILLYSQKLYAQGPSLDYLRTIGVINQSVSGEWDYGTSVDHDQNGAMLVAGNTRGANIYVKNADSLAQMTSNGNLHNIFVYKFNPSGGIDFAFTIEKVRHPEVYSLNDGGFYLIYSMFQDTIDANPNPNQNFLITPNGFSLPHVLSRFDVNGNLLWAFRLDLDRGNFGVPTSNSAIDNNENLVIGSASSNISATINMNPMGTTYPLATNTGILAKYNLNGQMIWAIDSVDLIDSYNQSNNSRVNERIAINSKNEIVLVSDLDVNQPIIDLDPSAAVYNLKRDSGEVMVATYDSNGNFVSAFNFGQDLGGAIGYTRNHTYVLRLDQNDNIYINGSNVNGDFDPDSTILYQIAQNPVWAIQRDDAFLASYTSTGKLRWVNPIRQEIYDVSYAAGDLWSAIGFYSNGYLINFRTDKSGNQYVVYHIRNKYDLDPGSDSVMVYTANVNLQSSINGQFVLAQYDSNGSYVDHTILYDTALSHSDYFSDFCIDDNCNFYATGTIGKFKSFTALPIYSGGNYIQYPIANGASLESDAIAIKYNFSIIPTPYLVKSKSNLNICEGETGKLFVGSKGLVEWYDSLTGGNLLFTGHEFQFPALYSNKTYYAQATLCSSNSSRLAVTINVTIINDTISRTIDTLWAGEPNATYQWIDCKTNLPISGATNQFYVYPGPGQYAVQITKGHCSKTSPCVLVAPNSMNNVLKTYHFSLHPNPAKNNIHIKTDKKDINYYQILNMQGARVSKGQFSHEANFDVSNLTKGLYFIHITNVGSISFIKE